MGLLLKGRANESTELKGMYGIDYVLPCCEANRQQVNALVYARVSLTHKDMEPGLECFDAQTHKAEGF